ncbi:hypothetical protein [Paenibacillus sp. FSL H3-0333]|uniref:hypothetical protein n=1 Tax=Paenibacillus sp. FSL H3-0333 TaxID=2921373 RepID=UPI0030FB26D9
MEKTAAGAYARSQLAGKRQEIQLAAALKQVQEQIEVDRRLNGPPFTLPDGTPITADNKENETTWDFYQAKVYVPNEYLTPMYTSYLGWLDNTYGLTKWESKVRQSGDVVLAFTEGLVKEVAMGVADTATLAFKLVVDPVKTTTEMKRQAQYLIEHPEVLVEAAKMAYHQFDEGTPEEKAKMLGSVASILVPGFQVTKAGKVGKVLGEVEDAVSQAAKEVLQGIKQKLPNLGPVVQTPEGFVFKIGEIPDTPALPKTPVQQRYMDGLEDGSGKIDGTGKIHPNGTPNPTHNAKGERIDNVDVPKAKFTSVTEYMRQEDAAINMYKDFKIMKNDTSDIAKNTGWKEADIQQIKNHLFIEKHKFDNGEVRLFDPNYQQALAWERLMKGNYNKNDISLLNHELFESKYMKKHGASYEQGHAEAQKYYNWSDSVFEE